MNDEQAILKVIMDLKTTVTTMGRKVDQLVSDSKTSYNYIQNNLDPNSDIKINTERNIIVGGFGMTSSYLTDGTNGGSTGVVSTVRGAMLTGKNIASASKDGSNASTDNMQVVYEHQPITDGGTNQSFFYANRPPIYIGLNNITISSSGSTFTDSFKNWGTNELANAYISVYDSTGAFIVTRQVASNTHTTGTINGTWGVSATGCSYEVYEPVYLGAADYPWRRLYAGNDIRFGYGPSAGTDVIFMKYGTGSPEGVVTANVGSVYFRTDGASGTSMYIKESGTGNTGWDAVSTGSGGSPVGSMSFYGANSAPTGWLICDGSAVSRTTYSALFSAISTTWGSGNGTTTFNIPDMRGRFAGGYSSGDTGLINFGTFGAYTGEKNHTLALNEIPIHDHGLGGLHVMTAQVGGSGVGPSSGRIDVVATSQGGGLGHNTVPPVAVGTWLIKT